VKKTKKSLIPKIALIIGTVLIVGVLGFTLLTALAHWMRLKQFGFDYLLPLEAGIFVLLGQFLIMYSSIRFSKTWKFELLAIVLTLSTFVLISIIANSTKVASGDVPVKNAPAWFLPVIYSLIALYWLGFCWSGILGISSIIKYLISNK